MPLKDQVPNRALSGSELKEIAVQEFRRMLDLDYAFQGSVAYPRAAFTLSATFHLPFPHPVHELKSRVKKDGVIEGEAPLAPLPENAAVVGLEREVTLENPNLDRVHHDLPIVLQRAVPPKPIVADNPLPGEPQMATVLPAGVENVELRYDKTDYPAPAEPVQRDVSAQKAEEMGVPARSGGGLGLRRKE